MTIREVSNELGLKVRTIREWISKGKIKAEKRGKCWYIFEDEINREEIQLNADKGREHSRRIKEGKSMGVLAGRGKDTKEPVQRTKRKKQ